MDVTPVDSHGAPATGTAPASATPHVHGAFDARLQQALSGGVVARPGTPVTLGQMLRLYAGQPVGATAATTSPVRAAMHRSPGAAATTVPGEALGVGPLARPLPGAVGSSWGSRRHPVHGDVRMHHGVDIGAPTGTPIRAFAAGTVTFAGARGGYGNVVIVQHANGVETRYAHQSRMDVVVGQRVGAGDVVGRVGATGVATGPHLHFEVRRDGESVDPAPYLP